MKPSLNRIVLSFAVAVSCTIGEIDGAAAQQRAPSKAPAAKGAQPANDTDRALDGAAKALDAGNVDGAMTSLDGILSGGGLSNQHMARALYLRGVANRKKGRPAQAIADLTNAVWLKDGLGESDRNAALTARGEISREVGVGGLAAPDGSGSGSSSRTRVASAPSGAGDETSSGSGFFSGIGSLFSPSQSAPAPEAAPEPRRSAPPSGPATSSWQSSTTVDPKERRQTAERPRQQSVVTDVTPSDAYSPPPPASQSAPPPASANRTAAAPQSSGGGLGSFFSGLFTGGASGSEPAQGGGDAQGRSRDQRVAAAEPPPAPPRAAPSVSPRARTAESKAGREASPITTSAIPAGAYRLQIATVRSRKEAEAVAARVRKEHVGAIGNRVLEVDETIFGGMGTFYRVRLGPFADVGEPQTLCNQLRPQGYDCLVVTN